MNNAQIKGEEGEDGMAMYIIVIVVALIGGIGTLLVGLSKENAKQNHEYESKAKENIGKIVLFYLIAIIAFIILWVLLMD